MKWFHLLILLLTVSFAVPESRAAEVLKADDKKDIADWVGNWRVFVTVGGYKNFVPDYSYKIDPAGNWLTLRSGVEQNTGKVNFYDGKMIFIPSVEQEKNAKTPRGIVASAIEKNRITLTSDLQQNTGLLLERRAAAEAFPAGELPGTWTLTQYSADRKETHIAPFSLFFKADKTYDVLNEKNIRNDKNSGTWDIKDGLLYLHNNAAPDSLWHQAVFFSDNGKLVLNRLGVFVYAQKTQ